MKYTKLGKTDVDISRICLGTMTWGQQNTQQEALEQMDYALENGVNFWDTAEMYPVPKVAEKYGKTEEIIGSWFTSRGRREDIVLATKISPLTWARGEKQPKINKQTVLTAVDNSLKRLSTDYIDLYQLHWPTNRPYHHHANNRDFVPASGSQMKEQILANIHETLETFNCLVKAGKIKHIGLSNDSSWGISQFCQLADKYSLPRIQSVQNEYNLTRRRDELNVLESCALEELSYLGWSPLSQGVLSGQYLDGNIPTKSRLAVATRDGVEHELSWRITPTCNQAIKEYHAVAKKHNLDFYQMAIAFTLRREYLSCSIIGASSLNQLKSNIAAIDLELSEEVLSDIEKIYSKYPDPF